MAPKPQMVAGATLEQFAGVTAAIAEQIPLEQVLAMEGISPVKWPAIDAGWKARIAASAELLAQYKACLAVAEDCLGRRVLPIDQNLEAWVAVLGAIASGKATAEGLGLRSSDMARLARRWTGYLRDHDLAEYAARLQKRPPPALPPLQFQPAALRPFPWTKMAIGLRAALPANAPVNKESLPPPSRVAKDFGLDTYAQIGALLEDPRASREKVCADFGTTEARYRGLDKFWRERFAKDEGLARDYRALYNYFRAQRRALRGR